MASTAIDFLFRESGRKLVQVRQEFEFAGFEAEKWPEEDKEARS